MYTIPLPFGHIPVILPIPVIREGARRLATYDPDYDQDNGDGMMRVAPVVELKGPDDL
jgi:hypothetical protein